MRLRPPFDFFLAGEPIVVKASYHGVGISGRIESGKPRVACNRPQLECGSGAFQRCRLLGDTIHQYNRTMVSALVPLG